MTGPPILVTLRIPRSGDPPPPANVRHNCERSAAGRRRRARQPSSGDHMRDLGPQRRRTVSRKLLLSVAAVAAAASIAGLATFATFTSSVSQSQSITTGTVQIALGATGASTNRLNIGATAVAPGDTN